MRLLGDERLARLAAAGHAHAFAIVYERHHQALYRYCRSIVRNDADAQDALQSTFTAAFAALARGARDMPIRPWLFRIAHNEAVSTLRRRRPTAELSEATDLGTVSVEDEVEERARLDLLLEDLRELHERQRSSLVMRELGGLSHEEIALALETSVGAAKQAIYEARRSLFEFGEGRAMPCDEIRRTISDADGRHLRSRRVRAHLRDCQKCAGFAAAIPERRRDLSALVPALPAVTAAGLLARASGAALTHGGVGASHGAGSGLAGLATGAAGKAAGASLAANALAGVAVVATATVGVTVGIDKVVHDVHLFSAAHRGASSAVHHAGPAGTPAPVISAPRSGPSRDLSSSDVARPNASGAPAHHTSRATAARLSPSSTRWRGRGLRPGTSPRHGASASASAIQAARTTETHPGHGPPPWAGSGSGHSHGGASAPGHSDAAPGHSGAAPGHSGAAPGHSGAPPGHTKAAGSSAAAGSGPPGQRGGKSGTKAGNGPPPWAGSGRPSGASAGHSTPSPAGSVTAVTSTPTPRSAATGPPAGPPGAAVSAAHRH
ncbi:MAG: sigma-70 family RNA polymerase sigma factor [Solirubrobacterales bacterium]|nr:sigma-70 family RNA polymerase sigma factor [Solirubrobacterales bacterium]